jgi:predicted nucleotide-binding protein
MKASVRSFKPHRLCSVKRPFGLYRPKRQSRFAHQNLVETKPKIFVGSSTEGATIAAAIRDQLVSDAELTLWTDKIFLPGRYILETLEEQAPKHHFAILVASPDDRVVKRGKFTPAMRDNVLLEFGLFTGALGRRRAFLIAPDDPKIDIPSDMMGITYATYESQSVMKGEPVSAKDVRSAAELVRKVVRVEWRRIQEKAKKTRRAVLASKRGMAVKRLSNVVTVVSNAFAFAQSEMADALMDRKAFEAAKRQAIKKVWDIAAPFGTDAKMVGVEKDLEGFVLAVTDAIDDLPFANPPSLSAEHYPAERPSKNRGKFTKPPQPTLSGFFDRQLTAIDELAVQIMNVRNGSQDYLQRLRTWLEKHSRKLERASMRLSEALLRAAVSLNSRS